MYSEAGKLTLLRTAQWHLQSSCHASSHCWRIENAHFYTAVSLSVERSLLFMCISGFIFWRLSSILGVHVMTESSGQKLLDVAAKKVNKSVRWGLQTEMIG